MLFGILPLTEVLKIAINSLSNDNSKLVTLKVRCLKHRIQIRNNPIDQQTLLSTFLDQFHLPPKGALDCKKPVILDLGSNIGLTCCHYKYLYPDSIIYGYELNKTNYKIAADNTSFYSDITLFHQGVWFKNDVLSYSLDNNNDAYKIEVLDKSKENIQVANLLSIEEIVDRFEKVDFLKMDIEGAEIEIFEKSNPTWLSKVKSLNIEFHLDKNQKLSKYENIIRSHGFQIAKKNSHWSSIIAFRP